MDGTSAAVVSFVGIDISKLKFDVAILPTGTYLASPTMRMAFGASLSCSRRWEGA